MNAKTEVSAQWKAALDLAEEGFNVFPISAGKKAPPVKGWQKWATQQRAKIDAYWTTAPNDNVGIATGDGLLVLDVDGEAGAESLVKLELIHGKLPDTGIVSTPSGGRHYYFSGQDVSNSAGIIAPGLDVRSKGGYVAAPGSVTDKGDYAVINVAEPAAAPQWLLSLCNAPRERKNTGEAVPDAPAALIERAAAWLAGHPGAVEGQAGDAHTFQTACSLRDLGLSEGQAFDIMAGEWNGRCGPPWPLAQLQAKVANAYRYAENEAGSKVALPEDFDIMPATQAAIEKAAKADTDLMWAGSIVIPEVWDDNYLIKGVLHAGDDAQLFGETNLGKTFIALNMGVHIAQGAAWMGQKTRQAGVLVLAYEGLRAMPLRLAALRKQFPAHDWNLLPLAVIAMRAPLVDERTLDQNTLPGRKRLQKAINRFTERAGRPPGLIIVDTYSKALGGSTSDEGLATKFSNMAQGLIEAYDATVLRIHHPGHTNKDRARGSYSLRAGVDSDIHVEDGTIHMSKQRDGRKRSFGFQLETVTLGHDQDGTSVTSCIVIPAVINALDLTERQAKVMGLVLDAAGGRDEAGRRGVLDAAKGQGISAADLRQVLAELKKKGRISYTPTSIELLERGAAGMFDDN
jgi:Bifunctional DNA primase/polymerase, N-terminal/AAA domain